MFKNAPMFKRVKAHAKGKNMTAMRQKDIQARSYKLYLVVCLNFFSRTTERCYKGKTTRNKIRKNHKQNKKIWFVKCVSLVSKTVQEVIYFYF